MLPTPITPADALALIVAPVAEARSSNGTPLFRCVCPVCGTSRLADRRKLGKLCRTCSCRSRATHGMSDTPLYRRWANMRARCLYPSATNFSYYGGRGIRVCAEWSKFEAFAEWALANGWSQDLEIDRIDADGNYEPANCRFIPHVKNSRLRRNARTTEEQAAGVREMVQSQPVRDVAEATGLPYMVVWHIARGSSWGATT